MKLIIDIPEEVKNRLCFGVTYKEDIQAVCKALHNGIPLEDIKAEITNIPITDTDGHSNNWYREPQAIIDDVIEIIDRYRKGE